jgi:hypothetical protein
VNRAQIELVRTSFATLADVERDGERASAMFRARVAEIAPHLVPALPGDPVAALGAVVAQLHDLHEVVRRAQRLAEEHVAAGGQVDDVASVRIALLWTLEQVLGPAYGPDVRNAWAATSGTLVTVMIGAAELATP